MSPLSPRRHAAISLLVLAVLASLSAAPALAQQASPKPVTRASAPQAAPQIPYDAFKRGITRTKQLESKDLQLLRQRMNDGKTLRLADLRRLADSGDSLAQLRFAKRLGEQADATLMPAQVHYYSMAAYNGRNGAVVPLISLLRKTGQTLEPTRLEHAETALLAQAQHGQADAIRGLAKFYLTGAPFGSKPEDAKKMLLISAKAGDEQAALDLALLLLNDTTDAAAGAQANDLLKIAAGSKQPSIRSVAETLIRTHGLGQS